MYAVQLSASIQESPPRITLFWEPDPYGASAYYVYRKYKTDSSWGEPIAVLPGGNSNFSDGNVAVGQAYEYQVAKDGPGYHGYGYIFSGIKVPAAEFRGKVVLVVASDVGPYLGSELGQLASDLSGDGWQVLRHDVSPGDRPESVRALIKADYYADPANLNSVLLIGRVPILHSGNLNYDSHGYRAMAADGYYGDMNDDWSTDPASSPSFFPSEIRLMVGRVDFRDMSVAGNETDLLRQYFNKDHSWRFKYLTAPRRALMANRIGDIGGIAPAASGYRAFEPLLGPGNTVEANVADSAAPNQRWISLVSSGPWLWTYGCGGGTDTSISQLGTHGTYNDVWSSDVISRGAKAVFSMLDGSHFADWDHSDNILRAMIAAPGYGLTACLAGGPHWYFHHMGLGETIGYSTRLTMNNSSLYQNQVNYLPRAVYVNLMGDPTLRMDMVAAPGAANASSVSGQISLNWPASPDASAGYLVYRADSSSGSFARITSSPVTQTSYVDAPGAGAYTYMVRALALLQTPSGSYYNLSQGVFATISSDGNGGGSGGGGGGGNGGTDTNRTAVIYAQKVGNTLWMAWPSQAGSSYHVQVCADPGLDQWTDASGAIIASGTQADWTDTQAFISPRRFYRIVSP